MKLEISPDERDVLREVVGRSLDTVRTEHRRTRNPEWQEHLHEEAMTLESLRERLDTLPEE
jgi:hypothetical protein